MTGHTKGPWTPELKMAYTLTNAAPFFQVVGPEGNHYWVAYVQDSPDGLGQANARLIAAAPELLEALKQIERETIDHVAVKIARAALAKAVGK